MRTQEIADATLSQTGGKVISSFFK